jgi:membrane protein implicated in regulation of membrane protease activity
VLIFLAITVAGLVLLVGGSLFGDDHDHGGHFDHDHGGDHGHEGDGDHGHNMPTVSIFSTKVIGTFIMGFGAAGFMAKFYGADNIIASLVGVGSGILISLLMFGVMKILYSQQSDSLIYTKETIGRTAVVTIAIDAGHPGKVEVTFGDVSQTYLARARDPQATFARGVKVRVAEHHGSELVVENVA